MKTKEENTASMKRQILWLEIIVMVILVADAIPIVHGWLS